MKKQKIKQVTVYSTPTCPFCWQVKDFLKQSNIDFEDIDVSADPQRAQAMIEKSGQMGVPVIDIDGQIVVGFQKEKLAELLGIEL